MTCPFTGEELALLPALNPDWALIHVQRCDAFGNAQLDGLQFMDLDLAMAAKRVIMTTERIVSNEQIRRTPDQTRIPFFTVEAVVEALIGCARTNATGVYEPFFCTSTTTPRHDQGPRQGLQGLSRSLLLRAQVLARLSEPSRHGCRARCVPPRQERTQ
jgi:acyl CoA:acetate/3-ketoacid CoA transferase